METFSVKTNTNSNSYSESQLQKIWKKATPVAGYDSGMWRKDVAGAWVKYSDYGDCSKKCNFGWQVDHRKPKSKNGTDELNNLRPLQWQNNESKGDSYPKWTSSVTSDGKKNICVTQKWKIEE